MTRFPSTAAALAALCWASAAPSADDKPAPKPAPPAAPDWSGYVKFSEVAGEVRGVSKDGFTLRVTWYAPSSSGGSSRSGASMYRSLMNGNTPYRRSGGSRPPRMQEHHEDYELAFADAGMVRWHKLSQGPGAGGKFVPEEEQNRLKLPSGAPGWAADRGDLQEGQLLEVTLVRPKDVPVAKATPADLRVKYAVIHGQPSKSAVLEKDKAKDKKK